MPVTVAYDFSVAEAQGVMWLHIIILSARAASAVEGLEDLDLMNLVQLETPQQQKLKPLPPSQNMLLVVHQFTCFDVYQNCNILWYSR